MGGLFDQYQDRLSREDRKWKEALQREGVTPRLADIEAAVARLQLLKESAGATNEVKK